MRTTENLGLQIPDEDEFYDVGQFANNMDILDKEVQKIIESPINDEAPTYEDATELTKMTSGEKISVAFGKMAKAINTIISHIKTVATSTVFGHVKVTTGNGLSNSSGAISMSKGNGTDYGSVKLSDTYDSKVTNGSAANSVGASQNALYEAYNEITNNLISDIYVGEDGKLHKVQGGADSVLPFSSIPKSGTVFTTSGVNLQEYFPNTWQKLRTSDFVCGVTSVSGTSQVGREDKSTGYNGSFSFSSDAVSVNYDSTTGILTFGSFSSTRGTKSWAYWNGGNNQNTVNVSGNNPFCAWKGTYSG